MNSDEFSSFEVMKELLNRFHSDSVFINTPDLILLNPELMQKKLQCLHIKIFNSTFILYFLFNNKNNSVIKIT